MKAVILAGGLGTRVSGKIGVRPKSMITDDATKMTGISFRRIRGNTGERDFTFGIGTGDVIKRVSACSSQ